MLPTIESKNLVAILIASISGFLRAVDAVARVRALVQGGDGGWLLGWVDFDVGVPPYCPADQPILPNFHLPRQDWADSGIIPLSAQCLRMSKYKVNPTQ